MTIILFSPKLYHVYLFALPEATRHRPYLFWINLIFATLKVSNTILCELAKKPKDWILVTLFSRVDFRSKNIFLIYFWRANFRPRWLSLELDRESKSSQTVPSSSFSEKNFFLHQVIERQHEKKKYYFNYLFYKHVFKSMVFFRKSIINTAIFSLNFLGCFFLATWTYKISRFHLHQVDKYWKNLAFW